MSANLLAALRKPDLDAPGADNWARALWDDEHISKGMLEAHLDPAMDAASRSPAFLDQSVRWIAALAPPPQFPRLLDLGCGPGLYAERFAKAGYSVTGVDFSRRSIAYAQERAAISGSDIAYRCQDYLTLEYTEQFDVITLIMGDYAVLSLANRLALLEKARRALKPGGKFIFDVFTPKLRREECRSWQFHESGGFFSEKTHLLLEEVYQYDDGDKTELRRSIVVTDDDVKCHNVFDHFFTKESLLSEIQPAGFTGLALYGDAAGAEYSESGETICAVLTR